MPGTSADHDPGTDGPGTDGPGTDDPESVARAIVLRQLTIAPRTRAQLVAVLARRGVPDDVAEAVLDRFEEVDLVDDVEFARQWVTTRHTGRGLSRRALRYELRVRGVDDETVRRAVDEIGPEEELEAARELVRHRFRVMTSDDPVRRTRRLAGMLARRGYGPAVAQRAIREVSGELGDEWDDGWNPE